MKKLSTILLNKSPIKNKGYISFLSVIFLISFTNINYAQCPSGYVISGTNQVVNGNFKQGNTGFTSQYTYVADQDLHTELYHMDGYYSIVRTPYDVSSNWSHSTQAIGDSGVFMCANGTNVNNVIEWSENITVVPNTTYYFSIWIASVDAASPAELQFLVSNLTIGSVFTASTDTSNYWQQFYATWNSGARTTATISIINKNTAATGNDFGLDNIYFVPCQLSLPVELLTFQVNCIENAGVEIYWATASETNNAYFTVERSNDAENWDTIATVPGAGNSNEIKYYSIKNNQKINGAAYYRLKQTDFNGNFKYYDWKYADCSSKAPSVQFIPDDDPNSNIMQVYIKNFKCHSAQMKVFDILGRLVYSKDINDINTNYFFDADLENLSNGRYFIQFTSQDYNKVDKILKF